MGENIDLEKKQAILEAERIKIQGQLNAASWSPHMEELIKAYYETR